MRNSKGNLGQISDFDVEGTVKEAGLGNLGARSRAFVESHVGKRRGDDYEILRIKLIILQFCNEPMITDALSGMSTPYFALYFGPLKIAHNRECYLYMAANTGQRLHGMMLSNFSRKLSIVFGQ